MPAFDVALVVENLELTDETLDHLFAVLPDAVPAEIGGLVTVSCPIEAPDAESAAFRLVETIGEVVPGAVPLRLDQDLVAIPDIAARTGRSRQSIRLLVEGERGPGGFPAPVGTVGDAIRVWPWASVLEWFAVRMDEDLGERGVPPEVAAVVDACLARRPLGHHLQGTWEVDAWGSRPMHAGVRAGHDLLSSDAGALVA